MTRNAARRTADATKKPIVVVEPQPFVSALHDRVHERHQAAGDGDRAAEVVAAMRVLVLRLRHEAERRDERDDAHGHVDEEDPRPRERLRQPAAEHEAERRTADGDRRPYAERLRALPALGERRRDDRQRRRGDERRAEALERAEADQHPRARREPVQERRGREDDEADEEEPLAAEQVTGTTAEQQEAAEDERVRVDDPLQVGLTQPEILSGSTAARRSRSSRRGRP